MLSDLVSVDFMIRLLIFRYEILQTLSDAIPFLFVDTDSVDTHIVQNLSFTLGHNITEHTRHFSMANVCRISRNIVFPPQFRTMQEWFHYAFATSELDGK